MQQTIDLRHILNDRLDRAIRAAGCRGIALVRNDGLPIAHRMGKVDDARRVAAMAASILGSVAAIAAELRHGEVNHVMIDCQEGKIVAVRAGPDAALIAWCQRTANLGLVLMVLNETAPALADALSGV